MGDGLGCNLTVCVWTIQGPTPGAKGVHHGAVADVMSWAEVFLFERNGVIKISGAHCAGCVLHLLWHTPRWTGWKTVSWGAIAFSPSNGPCWPPVPFACDPGRDIIRRRDGIRGQGRWTLGHAKATMELREVGKGWLMFTAAASIKPPHFCLLPSVFLFKRWRREEITQFLLHCQKCFICFKWKGCQETHALHFQRSP